MELDTREVEAFLRFYPTPWTQDQIGVLRDAEGHRVWDVPDANDDTHLAFAIMRLINQIGEQKSGQ